MSLRLYFWYKIKLNEFGFGWFIFFLMPELIFTHFLVNTYFQNQGGQGLSVALSALNAFNLLQPMGMVYNILLPVRRSNLILSLSYLIQSLLGMVYNLLLLDKYDEIVRANPIPDFYHKLSLLSNLWQVPWLLHAFERVQSKKNILTRI